MSTIEAGYRCRVCQCDRRITVRVRAPEEGVENYVYHLARKAGEDHGARSLNCPSAHVDLMLPVTSNGIGYAGDPLTPEQQQTIARQCPRETGGTQTPP